MGSSDKYWLAGGAIALLAGLMWYGDKLVKDGSKTLAENLKLPFSGGVNVTMPNINLGMPNINLGISGLNGDKVLEAAGQGIINNISGAGGLIALYDQLTGKQVETPTVPASSTRLASSNTNAARTAQIQAGTFWQGGIFTQGATDNRTNQGPTSSSSSGGSGIWVTDPKVQGGGYYVEDRSKYGWAGLPSLSAPSNASSQPFIPTIQSDADKAVIEAQAKANSLVNQQGWYIKDGVWRQRGVNGY